MQVIECQSREEWLTRRRESIGASESPAILGVGYADQSPMTVYESKVSDAPPAENGDKRLRIGLMMEPVLRELFEQETGMIAHVPHAYSFGPYIISRSEEYPWISASLDHAAISEGERVPVELKNVAWHERDEWEEGACPLKFQVQCSHQMLVTGASHAYLFGLIGGNDPQLRRIDRNDRFIAAMLERLEEFWGHVQRRQPPPVDASEATAKALSRLWPKDTGAVVELPSYFAELAIELDETKKTLKEWEQRKTRLESTLKAAIGDASYGLLPDGSGFSWIASERKGYTVAPATVRTLRHVKKVPQ